MGVWGFGFRGLGFSGLFFRGLGFRGLGVRGLGFRVWSLGFGSIPYVDPLVFAVAPVNVQALGCFGLKRFERRLRQCSGNCWQHGRAPSECRESAKQHWIAGR